MGMNFTDSSNWSKGSETEALDMLTCHCHGFVGVQQAATHSGLSGTQRDIKTSEKCIWEAM